MYRIHFDISIRTRDTCSLFSLNVWAEFARYLNKIERRPRTRNPFVPIILTEFRYLVIRRARVRIYLYFHVVRTLLISEFEICEN